MLESKQTSTDKPEREMDVCVLQKQFLQFYAGKKRSVLVTF